MSKFRQSVVIKSPWDTSTFRGISKLKDFLTKLNDCLSLTSSNIYFSSVYSLIDFREKYHLNFFSFPQALMENYPVDLLDFPL